MSELSADSPRTDVLAVTEPTFGSRLRELRRARELTQQSLGDALHYNKSWICRLENGHKRPTLHDARRLDAVLGTGSELLDLARRDRARSSPVPRIVAATPPRSELPPGPTTLVGRAKEVTLIVHHLRPDGSDRSRSVRVCLVHGLTGVGKTALATFAANQLRDDFPDGQLYIDLYGYTVDRPSVATQDALDSLLRRFLPEQAVLPTTVDDLVVDLRTRTAGKRLLVLMENASDPQQVDLLLSALPGSSAIVTSRSRLTALDDACRIELRELSEADGERLFRLSSGVAIPHRADPVEDRVAGEHIRRIVRSCYRFPFAIKIMAGRFRDNETLTLADVERVLSDERTKLDEMSDGDRSMVNVLRANHTLLGEPQRNALAALSLHPGVRLDRHSCAALLHVAPREAEKALDGLLRTYMVVNHSPGAYQMHDLIRDFLRHGSAGTHLSGGRRREVLCRLFDYYLRSAVAADHLIEPDRYRIPTTPLPDPSFERAFHSPEDALQWMVSEQENLLELCWEMHRTGFQETCWQFCYYLRGYFYATKKWPSWTEVFRVGVLAAQECGDRRAQGMMLSNVGLALTEAGDATAALPFYSRAIRLFEQAADDHGVATARAHLGWAQHTLGEDQQAYELTSVALHYYRTCGSTWNVATTGEALGRIELARGWTDEAITDLNESLRLFRSLGRLDDADRVCLHLRDIHATADLLSEEADDAPGRLPLTS